MKIAIVRGPSLNPWEMQSYEPLMRDYEILAIASKNPIYDIDQINLPIKKLKCLGEIFKNIPKGIKFLYQTLGDPQYLLGFERTVSGFDIVHTAETASAYSSQAVKAKKKGLVKKVVVTVWENIPFLGERNFKRKAIKQLVLANADHFLAVSCGAKQALIMEGAQEEKVSVVPVGVDLKKFVPERKNVRLAKELKIGKGDLVILSVGRLVWEKGFYHLLLAAKKLANDYDLSKFSLKFILVGAGPEKDRLIKLGERLNLKSRVIFVDSLPYSEMPEIFNLSDIFVLASLPTPYWREQFGMVLVEAMACGKPVVSTLSGAIEETVQEAGIFVPPGDYLSLAEAIKMLVLDEKARSKLAKNGRKRACEFFDSKVVANKIKKIYQKVIGG